MKYFFFVEGEFEVAFVLTILTFFHGVLVVNASYLFLSFSFIYASCFYLNTMWYFLLTHPIKLFSLIYTLSTLYPYNYLD